MAIKKSELYSSLWQSCDELRGGMDASQYKDYVLVLLFIKYVSDKYAGQPYSPIVIPPGASFKDMVALKGKSDIGDQINKKIIAPLANANKLSDFPDFNDVNKLGSGKDMVDRLTNLIAIFEKPELDFSKNRADGDDILGDAYEYLMRHFATESGKSKGQFYTPAEVSRIIAQVLGIREAKTSPDTTVYDPTCGSGSLLLKVADEAKTKLSLYGQEKDSATSGLARMNMILHDNPEAITTIIQHNIDKDAVIHTDEHTAYDQLNKKYQVKRVNHKIQYLNPINGACINHAESYFSRLRRAEIGVYHRIAGKYLNAYAAEMAYREDYCRIDNGTVVNDITLRALHKKPSVNFCGYWQRHLKKKTYSSLCKQFL